MGLERRFAAVAYPPSKLSVASTTSAPNCRARVDRSPHRARTDTEFSWRSSASHRPRDSCPQTPPSPRRVSRAFSRSAALPMILIFPRTEERANIAHGAGCNHQHPSGESRSPWHATAQPDDRSTRRACEASKAAEAKPRFLCGPCCEEWTARRTAYSSFGKSRPRMAGSTLGAGSSMSRPTFPTAYTRCSSPGTASPPENGQVSGC